MSDEDYVQATPEQKLEIAKYFIMSSPPGQVGEVNKDVIKLVNDPSVWTTATIEGVMKQYNETNFVPVETADGSFVVTKYGAMGDGEYLDPSTGKVHKVNHTDAKVAGDSGKSQDLSPKIAAYRKAIEASLAKYNQSHYKPDMCVISVYGSDDGVITVCLSARNVRLKSMWSGSWRSTFTINVSGSGTTDLSSETKVHVHYFEDGNVQLHAALKKTASVNVTDEGSTADAVAKAVEKIESDLQNNLEIMYVDMHKKTFKQMRRFLPITKEHMNWNTFAHMRQ